MILMTPAQWLDHLRSQNGYSTVFKWSADLENLIACLPTCDQQKAREVWESRVGSTVGKILDDAFQSEMNMIRPVLDEEDLQILSKTHIGLYLTYDFNAWAGNDPTGKTRVIVLHEGLPHALLKWSNCYVKFIELGGSASANWRLVFSHTVRYIASIWDNIPYPVAWSRPSVTENVVLAEELYNSALCFAVAHEIGHIRCGHKGYTDDVASNHRMEFEADAHGLRVATRFALARSVLYDDSWVYKFTLFAPLFFMSLLCLLGNTDSGTHPSASRRLEALIAQQEEVIVTICGSHTSALLGFLDEDFFEVMRRNSKGILDIAASFTEVIELQRATVQNSLPTGFDRV